VEGETVGTNVQNDESKVGLTQKKSDA